jgi:hypothetical protein
VDKRTCSPDASQGADISPATVEVRVLTVDARRMSLAMYRQLAEEAVEDGQGRLRGELWGWVNYHPDRECSQEWRRCDGHRHVVWQLGNELRRDTVTEPCFAGDIRPHHRHRANWERIRALGQLFIAV